MAQYTWTFDAPTGTYKNMAISRRLYTAVVEDSVFMDHVRPVEGYGKKMGENVTLARVRRLTEPTSAALNEAERIPEDSFTLALTTITPGELGRAVPYTSLAEDFSKYDIENPIQGELRKQMRLVLDTLIAAAYQGNQVKYAVTGLASNNIATTGTFGTASTANLNTWHLEQIRDYLYDTLLCPPAEGDNYVGIFRTLALRGVKQDPAWEEWHKYTNPAAKFNSEAGRWEDIRLIETNHNNALGKVGTGSVLGEGVVFGADAVAMAEVLSPELRAAVPADFGRSKSVAWYGIVGYDEIWPTANAGEARIVHVGST